jgi:hypothetical protein
MDFGRSRSHPMLLDSVVESVFCCMVKLLDESQCRSRLPTGNYNYGMFNKSNMVEMNIFFILLFFTTNIAVFTKDVQYSQHS